MNTICAISTPYGIGGIAVIRVSGEDAIACVDRIFEGKQALSESAAYTLQHGHLQRNGEELDEVMVSLYRSPHSFTGEDVVEIACHGSLYIQQTILEWLVDEGCSMARAGEFTQRAFLNGKMDLTQAEAVADLIHAQSKAEKDLALQHLKGGVCRELESLRERLLKLTALMELELDFADHEELEFANRDELHALILEIEQRLQNLTDSFRQGNAIRHGVPVAIIGRTNVGKSTLLNALIGEDRAIVSAQAGTTRDTIEDTLVVDGHLLRFIDTAGLRITTDEIENMGIARSRQAAEKADIILYVRDTTQPEDIPSEWAERSDKIVIPIWNKADLLSEKEQQTLRDKGQIVLSAKTGEVSQLKMALSKEVGKLCATKGDITISNLRHYQSLSEALQAVKRVKEGLLKNVSGEWISLDLNECLRSLGEITGQISSEEVLHTIFSQFCIGK